MECTDGKPKAFRKECGRAAVEAMLKEVCTQNAEREESKASESTRDVALRHFVGGRCGPWWFAGFSVYTNDDFRFCRCDEGTCTSVATSLETQYRFHPDGQPGLWR